MKRNFDLTPIVRSGSGRFICRVLLCAVPVVAGAALLGDAALATGLFRGAVLGGLDMVIMFSGMKRALPFVREPERGVRIMRRYRYYRLLALASIILLMLKMKFRVLEVFLGLLLIHIVYIINLLFVAYPFANERNVKKGV